MANNVQPVSLQRRIFAARMLIAGVQALALYMLFDAATAPSWPATNMLVFTPLVQLSVFVPLLLLLGAGAMPARTLAIWGAVAAVTIAGLGYHDAARGWVPHWPGRSPYAAWFRLDLAIAVLLFIAHALVTDAVAERRLVPSYGRHFDTAWKLCIQLLMAVPFVAVFWGMLYLGAGLFNLIRLDFLQRLIAHRWFADPATALAVAASIHVTDVQPAIIRGVRSLVLTLFSWLLPLLALIVAGFLGSLPFISLEPLWQTHFAGGLLLTVAGFLILLINCGYQDGNAEAVRSRVKRIAGSVAAIELLPLVGLAAWALALRVAQYGWTVQRISSAAIIGITGCYAIGYAAAVVRSHSWMKRIEVANTATAYVIIAAVLALFSPIADPARLMVLDQMARLRNGSVAPDQFDFVALRFDGARWGAAALEALRHDNDGPDSAVIARRADAALKAVNRVTGLPARAPAMPADIAARFEVYPSGRTLPAGFTDGSVIPSTLPAAPACVWLMAAPKCLLRFIPLRPDAPEAILFVDQHVTSVFEQAGDGTWHKTAAIGGMPGPDALRDALRQGAFTLEPHVEPDIVIGGERAVVIPVPPPVSAKPR